MLRAGARIIRADLAVRPLPTLLTGLVIAVAAGALLVTLHLRSGLDDPFDALFRATSSSHVIVAGPPAEVRRATGDPQIARADAPRAVVVGAAASWHGTAGRVDLVELPPAVSTALRS
jgi:putative ABC transport system permease protein